MSKEGVLRTHGYEAGELIRQVLYDDIEASGANALKWSGSGTGSDWIIERSTSRIYKGEGCLRLVTKATTPAAGDAVTSRRHLGCTEEMDKIRVGFFYDMGDQSKTDYQLDFTFDVYTLDGYLRRFQMIWDGANETWKYRDSGNQLIEIDLPDPSVDVDSDLALWNFFSLIGLPNDGEYAEVILNGSKVSMPNTSCYSTAHTTRVGTCTFEVKLTTLTADQRDFRLDELKLDILP